METIELAITKSKEAYNISLQAQEMPEVSLMNEDISSRNETLLNVADDNHDLIEAEGSILLDAVYDNQHLIEAEGSTIREKKNTNRVIR